MSSNPATKRSVPSRHTFGLRHVMFGILVLALALWGLRDLWQVALLFLLTVSPVLLVCGVVVAIFKRRSTEQEALLSVLTIAADHRLPLAPGAEAFSGMCSRGLLRGGFQQRVLAFSYLLDSGVALPQALDSVPNLLPEGAAALASVGWAQGALGAGLHEAQATVANRRTYMPAFLSKLAYFTVLMLALQAIGGFIIYFIVPKFEAIFADFGVPLPSITRFAIQVGALVTESAVVMPIVVLAEIFLLIYLPFSFAGLVRWRLPGAGMLLRRRDTAAVLRGLAVTVDAGNPISTGLELLRDTYPIRSVKRQLEHARVLAEHGIEWTEALRTRGVIRKADVAVLASAQRAGNLGWALRVLADGYERRLGYRLTALSQFLLPIIILCIGAVVCLFAVGYFMPLVLLIRSLAG